MFGFLAQLLNWCYTIWTNYAGMIVLFTFILMVVITPPPHLRAGCSPLEFCS